MQASTKLLYEGQGVAEMRRFCFLLKNRWWTIVNKMDKKMCTKKKNK